MWSFCIFDKNKGNIFLSRDRFGEKPLYYSIKDNSLFFASEIKALFASKKIEAKISKKKLKKFLNEGPIEYEHSTIYEEVFYLMPGSYFHFSINENISKIEQKKFGA